MADGIAHRRRRHLRGVGSVQAHAADLIVLIVDDGDSVLLLQHLQSKLHGQGEGRVIGPALVRSVRIGVAAERNLAFLLDDFRGFGLQDRIAVIADELADIAGAVGHTRQIHHRLRPALDRLEIEGVASPPPREIGRPRAVIGKRRVSKHRTQHQAGYGATNGHGIFLHQKIRSIRFSRKTERPLQSGTLGAIARMRNQITQIVHISRARFMDARCKALLSGEMIPPAMTRSVVNPAHPSE